jgi:carbon monoxide dehydrogenase subunit G
MTFTQTCTIAASREAVWEFLMEVENVAHCLPGVEAVTQLDDDTYEGTVRVKVGPIGLSMQGTLRVEERDRERWHGAMRAEAKDRKLGGGVRARLSMDLLDHGPTETQLRVTLEANVLGKIGEFGQPVMRKKADALLQEFADQVGQRLLERM